MDIIEFYQVEQKRLHDWMRAAVSELTHEEWHYLGTGKTNNIAFLVWHCARTEDNILRFILQGRAPIWNEGFRSDRLSEARDEVSLPVGMKGGWHERLGLPPRVQGTGMATDDARTFQIADIALFMQYVEEVWREFEEYTAAIQDGGAELSARTVTVKPLGNMSALQTIGQVCISHPFIHLGEISYILGELGKRGLPF